MKKPISEALQESFFNGPDSKPSQSTYEERMQAYAYLKSGDKRAIQEFQHMFSSTTESFLSANPLLHWKYMVVASATLCCTAAIEAGLDPASACDLSNLYIQKLDKAETKEESLAIHDCLAKDFLSRIRHLQERPFPSLPVACTLDYIDKHLHTKIRLSDLAEAANVTPNYLSSLFAKEMNETISRYIRKRRIKAAMALLKHYDYSISEISQYLGFSSPSHFIQAFREETGTTPILYKDTEHQHEGYDQ